MIFSSTIGLLLLSLAHVEGTSAKSPLPTDRPYNIGHRGASGELPEHTKEAYALAIHHGADFIECDVVVTKDKHLICRHEPNLSLSTDADEKFPEKRGRYTIDGEELDGVFSVDLTLEEIRSLTANHQEKFKGVRGGDFDGQFGVCTLEEHIDIALNSVGKVVGIYPETIYPQWTNSLDMMSGTSLEQLLLEVVEKKGYRGKMFSESWAAQPIFIQSMEVRNLKFLSGLTEIPLVQLVGWTGYNTREGQKTPEEMITEESLGEVAEYAVGVGAWKGHVLPVVDGDVKNSTGLVERMHAKGLLVHVYTFRNDDKELTTAWGQDHGKEYRAFVNGEKIDGIFTDFPGSLSDFFKSNMRCKADFDTENEEGCNST
ncbi:hypothetical protein BSKO_13255 [Bryopsis sp. KO-2023]|nr:hypothetical protein BSKO_13255 [Bryopsis sp. KO-2023]